MSETDELRLLEEGLWRAETRFDRAWMDEVLAPDFFEFGRSGRIYRREDTLAIEQQPINARLSDFAVHEVAEDVRLCTYVSDVDGELGNRSSLWVRTAGAWRLRFHQGTPR